MIRFCHQKLLVSDLERAIAFYEEQFELKVLARMTSGGGEKMAWLGYGGAGDFFLELGEGTPAPGGQHIAFVTDARNELNEAVSEDPNNAKYATALKHMEEKMQTHEGEGYARSNVYNYRDDGSNERSYSNEADYRRGGRGMTPCDCCTSLLCADCCCECMGGDLISCC